MKFRKKPIIIEAIRWTGDNIDSVLRFDQSILGPYGHEDHLEIPTLEGHMIASVGDWIIRGVKGEIYPCKDEIFRATYDTVQEINMGHMKTWWIFGYEWWGGLRPAKMTTAKGVSYKPLFFGIWIITDVNVE